LNQVRIPFLAIVFGGIVLALLMLLLAPGVNKEQGEEETPEAIGYQVEKNT